MQLLRQLRKVLPQRLHPVIGQSPFEGIWFIKKPKFEESFLAIIIMGIVFVQNITMLEIGAKAQSFIESITGVSSYSVTFTITFVIAMAIPVLALYLTGWLAGKANGEPAAGNFARFGYALIPLDLAGHLAHNLFHLLAEGKSVFYTGIALFGINVQGPTAIAGNDTIQILQFILVGLGTFLSIYTAYRIARSNFEGEKVIKSSVPVAGLIMILSFVNVYLFTLPMGHRM